MTISQVNTKESGDLTAVYRVNGRTSYEECFVTRDFVKTIQTQRHVKQNRESILSAVDQMGKCISGIIVTP